MDVKVRDYCYVTGEYRDSAHSDSDRKGKLNHKIPIEFYNLLNSHSYLIMRDAGKFDFKVNIISNGLQKSMRFNIY